ncbi:MAG: helix-turn-helix domain-containing protein [Oscillospiraceae bacterium]|jgi:transcriptional regulator with XRE-family HTH domain|nr:helix-turn-helix domain-containing protein [Oscillospiraceae bacterium]
MNIAISENIRRLRRARDITQEELANALGVTPQSVSKWEVKAAYPDMELIPLIANYFNISTDELFGMDAIRDEKRVDEFISSRYLIPTEELLERHREIIREFPNSAWLKLSYASCLYQKCFSAENCHVAIEILKEILEKGEPTFRESATFMLIDAYEKLGESTSARKVLEEVPPIQNGRQFLHLNLLRTRRHEAGGLTDDELQELRGLFGPFALSLNWAFNLLLSEKQRRGQGTDEEYYRILVLLEQLYPYLASPSTTGYRELDVCAEVALQYAAYYAESDAERAVDYVESVVESALNTDPNTTYPHLEYTGEGDDDVIVHDVTARQYIAYQIAYMSKANPQRTSTAADTAAATNGGSLDPLREHPRFVAAIAKLAEA